MKNNASGRDKATFWTTIGLLGVAGIVKGHESVKFRLGGKRIEIIEVNKIRVEKSTGGPKLRLSQTTLIKAELLNLPVGGKAKHILEAKDGSFYVIPAGSLHLRGKMKPGKVYECEVLGDPDWGIPKIVRMIKEVVPETNLDEEDVVENEEDATNLDDQ